MTLIMGQLQSCGNSRDITKYNVVHKNLQI